MAAATVAAGLMAYEQGRGRLPEQDVFAKAPPALGGDPLGGTSPEPAERRALPQPAKTF